MADVLPTQNDSMGKSASVGGVRPCRRSDLTAVVEIFEQGFGTNGKSASDLARFFEQAYFDNPWVDNEIPSLVYEHQGTVIGFLGVIPRPMRFEESDIHAAVSSGLAVRADGSGNRHPFAAVELMRRFLGGQQDLSLTDTANEASCRLWTACGGEIAYPYSYSWTRPLQPLSTCLQMGVNAPLLKSIAGPVCRVADAILSSVPPLKPANVEDCELVPIDTEELLSCINDLPPRSVTPTYDLNSLQWLLAMAEQSESEGPLVKRAVKGSDGRQLGWFVYYQNKGGFGRVLQLVANGRSMDRVFDSLLMDARRAGVVALWGRTDPQHAALFGGRRCLFQARPSVLVHSSRPEIVQSFQRADAFFSGFEGELWMKTNA